LAVQNGASAPVAATRDPVNRYIANGRDLAEYVHVDFSYQAFQSAALILLGYGGAALDDANPYKSITNQGNFVTFGGPMILDLVTRVAIEALKAAWYQKWLVHRRLRPEAYGGLVHHHLTGSRTYPLHRSLLNSAVLPLISSTYGSYLLPVAYPEGCPLHPAYPAGHATIAGACVTVLKAFFKESFVINSPVQASADGLSLIPHAGVLTVGGELNKLASNISLGRDTAGVHWRTDGDQGMYLGEEVAIRLLRDHKLLNNEPFAGFSLRKFNGSTVTI
jgi:membrane-associated phospholipid phosphatase